MLRTLLILGRMSNLPTAWTNVLAGWFLAGGGWSMEILWIVLGVSLLYVAGMTLNDACDQEWDRQHAPERPIPSGAISGKAVWMIGIGQLLAGVAVLLLVTSVDWTWVLALVGAILLYDFVHKKTVWAVLAMGACRGLVYLVAGSAVSPDQLGWWAAVATSIYVVGITVLARSERSSGEGRSFGGIMANLMLIFPVIAGFAVAPPDPITKLLHLAWFLPLTVWVCRALINQRVTGAIGPMVGQLIAGIVLVDAAILGISGSVPGAVLALALLPVTVLLQRRIPAT